MNTLFQLYPALASSIPHVSLGKFPTPIDGPFEVGPHKIWLKRDDLSGEIHGGNKIRKLEVALGEARQRGVSTLVLGGAKGSNWCVAATIYGKELGFRIKAILFPQPITPFSERNFSFTSREAQEIIEIQSPILLPFYLWREKKNKDALALPMGGTSTLTSLGYVNAALELKEQIDGGILPEPQEIWIPLGTGGTVAGLVAGLKLAGLSSTIKAVRVVDRIVSNRWRTLRMAQKVEKILMKRGVSFQGKGWALEVIHSAIGKGYGHPTDQGTKGIDFFREVMKIQLEPTYTGKAAGALQGRLDEKEGKNILFWNTYNSIPLPEYRERWKNLRD